jgi:hypothetical protein
MVANLGGENYSDSVTLARFGDSVVNSAIMSFTQTAGHEVEWMILS